VARVAIAAAALVLAAGCGADGDGDNSRARTPAHHTGRPTEIKLPTTPKLRRGRDLVAASGCLGCHRIGRQGNQGPGPDLTHVGSSLPRTVIQRALIDPEAPMPSYSSLSARKRAALVAYLASLR
jgi:ubiquinol-cytochrome c reductase cytochrome b subunit/menaquinol-cytochrome c reductase cytochrome b/c subunit